MFLLATVLLFGLASAQKVTDMTSCSTDTNQLRIDCKYEPAEEGTVCKYTQGDRELGATNVPKDAANKNRDTVSLVDKNNCQLILNNLPDGKNNFTCSIEQKETASMSTMVEKKSLPPCSAAWSPSLTRWTGALLGVSALPLVLQVSGLM
ncbi:unnamed protein product [Gadus morhua 'NCC']|uniref:Uncharacterized protein n=1 Tax=Gadus morhua TaxID=8049 RepID=A0A8C5CD69_GADMO